LIVYKLLSEMPRDIEDVQKILICNKSIDKKFITLTLTELGTALDIDLVQKFRAVVG